MGKKNESLIIRINPDQKKQLWKEAKKEDRTLSNYVLRLVAEGRKAIKSLSA